jgi:transcription termination factor NusB
MNIKSRIISRKLLLVCFYQKLFLEELSKNNNIIDDIVKIDKSISYSTDQSEEKIKLQNIIQKNSLVTDEFIDDDVLYLMKNVFDKVDVEFEIEYIKTLYNKYNKYKLEIEEIVNKHTVSFSYSSMDLMDKSIFLLGYIESKEYKTDKKIIMNEMIELAKRY